MRITELFILAVGLSMDAFAVAICKGLAMKKVKLSSALIVGIYFGVFQACMPVAGYFLASTFSDKITGVDHWIAFALLTIIGGNMIREAVKKNDEDDALDASLKFSKMVVLAIATSIDALAVGVSFAMVKPVCGITAAVLMIGVITLALSMAGVKIGNIFGTKYKSKAELSGGVILILLGLKILLEHLGVINF